MKNWLLLNGRALVLGVGALFFFAGCEAEGPAEKAGEKIDQGVQDAKDAVNPSGPAEDVGAKIDKATKDVGEKIDKAAKP